MKNNFYPLKNVIQNYAWGSVEALNTLFGMENPEKQPQAELWMGAHLNGCSMITENGETVLLSDFIAKDMHAVLGQHTAEMFGELPYLFKILNAGNALSVQVHPNKSQAEEGFALEKQLGMSMDDPKKNYRDANHKPELVYALTSYQAMNGFRPYDEIIALFIALNSDDLMDDIQQLTLDQSETGLTTFFTSILSKSDEEKEKLLAALLRHAEANKEEFIWSIVCKLSTQYPGDIGLFAPLMLNTITLNPGEAMYLDAGIPHAYIEGTGLEIMANSDNVLRAGLTPKHIDLNELVKCTDFVPLPTDTIRLAPTVQGQEANYEIPVSDFKFSVFAQCESVTVKTDSAEILLAIDADVVLTHASGETLTFAKGESVFIPAYVGEYSVTCQGKFARAFS